MSETSLFPDLLGRENWAMLPGERTVLEGLLAALQPTLSVEIGTDKGGSLERICAHSVTVHAFDLIRLEEITSDRFPNLVFHEGDSHELLPGVLAGLAVAEQNVDFVFVDGDHTAVGVRRDLEDLLSSPCVGRTAILVHDTLNTRVRAGLEEVDYDAFDKVRFVDLDFVPGRALQEGGDLWAGLGIIVTGWELGSGTRGPLVHPVPESYAKSDDDSNSDYSQLLELERDLAVQRDVVRLMQRSWSWRITAPARRLSRLVVRRG